MVSNSLRRCAKYIMVMKNIITFECSGEDRTFIYLYLAPSTIFQPMKRLYPVHFEELLGHFDYGYFYAEHYHQQKFHLRCNCIIYVIYT